MIIDDEKLRIQSSLNLALSFVESSFKTLRRVRVQQALERQQAKMLPFSITSVVTRHFAGINCMLVAISLRQLADLLGEQNGSG